MSTNPIQDKPTNEQSTFNVKIGFNNSGCNSNLSNSSKSSTNDKIDSQPPSPKQMNIHCGLIYITNIHNKHNSTTVPTIMPIPNLVMPNFVTINDKNNWRTCHNEVPFSSEGNISKNPILQKEQQQCVQKPRFKASFKPKPDLGNNNLPSSKGSIAKRNHCLSHHW